MALTKSELVQLVAHKSKLQPRQAEQAVDVVIERMVEALCDDDRIEIRGFGSFVNRTYGAYSGRNPKTGEPVTVQPKRVPFFKVGKELKVLVEKSSSTPEEE